MNLVDGVKSGGRNLVVPNGISIDEFQSMNLDEEIN